MYSIYMLVSYHPIVQMTGLTERVKLVKRTSFNTIEEAKGSLDFELCRALEIYNINYINTDSDIEIEVKYGEEGEMSIDVNSDDEISRYRWYIILEGKDESVSV